MPQAIGLKRAPTNYSHCPLKKRPIKYDLSDSCYSSDSDHSNQHAALKPLVEAEISEPENLSTKPEDLRLLAKNEVKAKHLSTALPTPIIVNHQNKLELVRNEEPVRNCSTKVKHEVVPRESSSNESIKLLKKNSSCPPPIRSPQCQPPVSASIISPPPLLQPLPSKVFSCTNNITRPLEPISLNSQVPISPHGPHHHHHQRQEQQQQQPTWPHQHHRPLPFNFAYPATTPAQHQHQQTQQQLQQYTNGSYRSTLPQQFHPTSYFPNFIPSHISPPQLKQLESQSPLKSDPLQFHQHHHYSGAGHSPVPILRENELLKEQYKIHNSPKHYRKDPATTALQIGHFNLPPANHLHHHHHPNSRNSKISNISRSGSLSSGSDRSSPIPDSSLSPCSNNSARTTTTPNNNSTNGSHNNQHSNQQQQHHRYQCPDCQKSYSTFSGLSKHLQFHCCTQNKKSFTCKFCEKMYTTLGALKMHIRTHTLPCKCTICGKAFSRPWLLQGHVRTHTGEKPFSCDFCHRAFADRSNLRAHLQTHSEIKKYSCQFCSKTFSRTSLLAKHKESGCGNSSE